MIFCAGGVVRADLDLPESKGKFYPSAFFALSFKGLEKGFSFFLIILLLRQVIFKFFRCKVPFGS